MSFWSPAAFEFWRWPMAGIVLAAALCAFLGVYVLLRRVVFVGAALTQISGVGVAFAFWIGSFVVDLGDQHVGQPWYLRPSTFSIAAALLGGLLFSLNRGGRRLASETIVGLGWVIASALVLLILSSSRIVQEAHEIDDLLYGTAVLINAHEVKVLGLVTGGVLAIHVAFFKQFLFITYDAEMAQTLGYKTKLWDMLLYATLGIGLSFAVQTVGALPAFAFLVIPAAAALLLVERAVFAFPLAVLFGVCGGALGYYLAFTKEYPTGAAMVAASSIFLIPGLLRQALGKR